MSDQLHNETSPYVLQHKDNPVNWFPWCDEAFKKAREENKYIFLSIGYSTCHWCHVMAHESFEDKEVAESLNKNFVSIKMDREQYPHIDGHYQKIYQIMHGRGGGWPLSIFMTHDKKVFFSGTYIPKYPKYNSKGLLAIISEINNIDKKSLSMHADEIANTLNQYENKMPSDDKIDTLILDKAIDQYKKNYDYKYKGFGTAPKFPQFVNLILLLKSYQINGNESTLSLAIDSLKAMAYGGIFDQIEGGFYRYSVDEKWKIPHFEKMLYTNAEALEAYTLAYTITKDSMFKHILVKIVDEMDKRFLVNGMYKSASNADSKNDIGTDEEGFYFVYKYFEVYEYLKEKNIDESIIDNILKYLDITPDGNFENNLSNPNITSFELPVEFGKIIGILKEYRNKKEYPFIDNKINTAWNALYIKGKLYASKIDNSLLDEAVNSLNILIDKMIINNELYHQTIEGIIPSQKAILEDYSFLSSALFTAYQETLEEKYYIKFEELILLSIEKLYRNGRWLESNDGFETFSDIDDHGYASSLGVHLQNLIIYASIEGKGKILEIVNKTLKYFVIKLNNYPSHFPNALTSAILLQMEPIIIKSSKENLSTLMDKNINYPFVYKKVEQYKEEFLACKIDSCFSSSKDFSKIQNDIEALVKSYG